MARWEDGKMGRWEDEKMGRWRDREKTVIYYSMFLLVDIYSLVIHCVLENISLLFYVIGSGH